MRKQDNPWVHFVRGNALRDQGRPREAEAAFRAAIRLKPDFHEAQYNLGVVLDRQGRRKEAEAAFREAIRLKPDDAASHLNLGVNLNDGQGRRKEAEAAFREAIRLKPDDAKAHYNLGVSLTGQGRPREAEAAYREAIRLKPDYAEPHNNLGTYLHGQNRPREAEVHFREFIRLKPDHAVAQYNLGNALASQDRNEEAEAAYREAIRLKPDFPEAHCNLGHVLKYQGRFTDAQKWYKSGHELGSKNPGWHHPSAQWIRQVTDLIELDRKLPTLLLGDAEPGNSAESLALAILCRKPYKRLHAAASRFFTNVFATDPRIAADLQQQNRYHAACSAALAAAGQGEDARLLPDKVAFRLRRQALDWLKDDLTAYAKLAERDQVAGKKLVRERLEHRKQDPDLASVRDPEALGRLPEAERQAWRQLWADVSALHKKVADAGPTSP